MGLGQYKMSEKEYEVLSKLLEQKQLKKQTKNLKKLRCAIYARKSQEDTTDTSLETQINYCKEIIDSCNLLELTSIYQEDDVSGYFLNRPQFLNMIQEVLDKKIDVVVVYSIDRFSRNSGNTFYFRDEVIHSGAYLLQGDDSNVVDSASSQLAFQVKVILNDYMGRTSAERTYITMRNIVQSQGRYVSGSAPYGYVRTADGKLDLEIDEAIIVNDIFEKIISGYSLGQIANLLNQQGSRTKKGNYFNKSTIYDIARNKIYTGTYIYDKKKTTKSKRVAIMKLDPITVENAFPSIVSNDTYEEVQKILEQRTQIRNNDSGHIYLLSGLLRCKNCSRVMVGSSTVGR